MLEASPGSILNVLSLSNLVLNALRNTHLGVANMVSYWPQLKSEDDDIAGFVFGAKAVACKHLHK